MPPQLWVARVYTLQVFYKGDARAQEVLQVARAADVLNSIPELLQKHSGCERISVLLGASQLFAVDCRGERIVD